MKPKTVGDLRKWLAKFPEDTPVLKWDSGAYIGLKLPEPNHVRHFARTSNTHWEDDHRIWRDNPKVERIFAITIL